MNEEDFSKAEIDAIEAACKRIENMMKRPDQLERVEQIRRRESRKKASVEARLKTAMQSQLDGVRTGLSQLQSALSGIREVRGWIQEVDGKYRECAELSSKLGEVKEVAQQHSQLAAAVENLKHIFTVPENIIKTEKFIQDEKLLEAHKGLMELESSRDDLLYELHKHPSENPTDDHLLKQYFSEVGRLSEMLFRQLKLVMHRVLNAARENPSMVTTALRIIEREERIDKKMLDREKMAGFKAPDRPKSWKKKCFDELKQLVLVRIEGTQLEDRTIDKMWLVRHLELIRQNMVGDLKVVKFLLMPCFPPHYNIFDHFINMFQECLAVHLQEMISDELEPNEIISLLTWLNEYRGPMMMSHAELGIDIKKLPPLLPPNIVEDLQQQYLKTLHTNIQRWMGNALQSDVKDWQSDTEPDADGEGYFRTQLPVIIFQMIEQNLQVSNQISTDLTTKVVLLCIEELQLFIDIYRCAIKNYKKDHLADRSQPRFYFQYMVAVVNNFMLFIEFTKQLEKRHLNLPANEPSSTTFVQNLVDSFNRLSMECMSDLIGEMLMDLQPHLQQLLSRTWLQIQTSPAIDTVCVTIEDYYRDFVHLKKNFFEPLVRQLETTLVTEYIKALVEKRMTFRSYEERRTAADKMFKESEQIEALFERILKREDKSPCEVIPMLAEVIKLMDTSLLSLEISGLVNKYADIRTDHLVNLLVMRGDMSISSARQVIEDVLGEDSARKKTPKTIFSLVK
ncbi:exocyst complex component 3-like isoform X3 [Acanthaster planci]|uniref:Exocyst complex component 3-like isoform X1 n=1 Tax=Acanthaster planci TaxID=133434 RepID=A0A8B7Z975_ACAPL|nr:exocyst complex component 3-like isoform X1 [Acanthaster planci]XP_022101503.1 exocyst complex component 3-like isoform X2 [Acanthaster planci]XP_022101504.1 exocyst complex component 3-like isoform X3 [Acanthaster planci]